LASERGGSERDLAARGAAVIRIDAVWLATQPVDMRAGVDRLLSMVVAVFARHKSITDTSSRTPAPTG
jgi:hypothetical protein